MTIKTKKINKEKKKRVIFRPIKIDSKYMDTGIKIYINSGGVIWKRREV